MRRSPRRGPHGDRRGRPDRPRVVVRVAHRAHRLQRAASRQRCPNAKDVYWEPRTVEMVDDRIRPGRRRPTAIASASTTSSAGIRDFIAQPTTRRPQASDTTAKVQPAAASAHLRDVGHPHPIGAVSREVPPHQVGRGPGLRVVPVLKRPRVTPSTPSSQHMAASGNAARFALMSRHPCRGSTRSPSRTRPPPALE